MTIGHDGELLLAEANKERGMAMAEDRANRLVHGWSDAALEMLVSFLNTVGDKAFLAEEARKWASEHGLPDPPNDRAWGGVIRRASFMGLIKFSGYSKTTNPRAHRTPAAKWAGAVPAGTPKEGQCTFALD